MSNLSPNLSKSTPNNRGPSPLTGPDQRCSDHGSRRLRSPRSPHTCLPAHPDRLSKCGLSSLALSRAVHTRQSRTSRNPCHSHPDGVPGGDTENSCRDNDCPGFCFAISDSDAGGVMVAPNCVRWFSSSNRPDHPLILCLGDREEQDSGVRPPPACWSDTSPFSDVTAARRDVLPETLSPSATMSVISMR